jgi:hypothetical protein
MISRGDSAGIPIFISEISSRMLDDQKPTYALDLYNLTSHIFSSLA